MTEPNRQSGENEEKIIEIEIERLRPFKEHPFQVKDDKEMFLLQESINDCITFFVTIGKGIVSLLQEFVTGADSFGQLSNRISNSIISEIVYWLIAAIVMGILFIMTGLPIVWIGYQVGKIYRKYCWDIISIMMAIMSTAIAIYFGKWIKSIIPMNLILLLLLVHVVYIGIRCYVKDWREERGYY